MNYQTELTDMAGEETTNQGNIRNEYNVATTGMNMDNSVNQVPKGSTTYALNAAVENFDSNSVNYQNEPGNEFCLKFPDGYQLIGEHAIIEQNKHIFFLANPTTGGSQIGYMDNNDCIYRIYIDAPCLNFNIHYPIHKAVHKITNCTTEIYWTDGYNPRRFLDLNAIPYILKPGAQLCDPMYLNEIDCNQLKMQPNFTIPQLEVVGVQNGGALISGTYQFAIQYSDASGNAYTSYYSVTNPTPIADTQKTTLDFNYEVGRAINVSISNLDGTGQFQYFNLAVIKTINNITSVELVGTYFIDKTSRTITYTGQNQTQIRLTINDIFEKYPYYDIAQDLTAVQDILVWDNLTSIDRINYQSVASQISLQWETYRIPDTEDYSDELNATNLRGYLRDEVYAFEIVFLLKNGKQTDGFHIPGRVKNASEITTPDVPTTNDDFIGVPDTVDPLTGIGYSPYWKIYNTGSVLGFSPDYVPADQAYKGPYQYGEFAYWESTELYPCNKDVWGDLADQPIRHHKFPDVLVSPVFESKLFSSPSAMVMGSNAVFPMGVRVDAQEIYAAIQRSGDLTQAQKDDIVGFKIVRGDRSTNKSIVAKGMLRNVGKYKKEGTEYYFPNYPYNDLRKDPFLLDLNNAYTATINSDANIICRSFTIHVAAGTSAMVEYLDCYTNTIATKEIDNQSGTSTKTEDICSLDFPSPKLLQIGTIPFRALATCNTYTRWAVYARGGGFKAIPANLPKNSSPTGGANWHTFASWQAPHGTPPAGYTTWVDYCLSLPNESGSADGYKCDSCLKESDYTGVSHYCNYNSQDCGYTWYFDSLIKPFWDGVNGVADATIEKVADYGYDLCIPKDLDAYADLNNKYRLIFNSPETSFGQPFLGDTLRLENVIYGAGEAHFTQVKDNAFYKLLTKEAQQDALASSDSIAAGDITALFAAYQAYLTIYVNGITRRNYAWSFNSIAKYNYGSEINNDLGIKQRPIDFTNYLIPGVQSVGDNLNVNNWSRESSVFIKTSEELKPVEKNYATYLICNTNAVGSGVVLTFQYTDPTIGTTTIPLNPSTCNTVDSTTPPVETTGATTGFTITITGGGTLIIQTPTPSLPFPNETPSLLDPFGNPIVEDDTRFVLSDPRGDCNNPGTNVHTNTVVYYASMKNTFVNQWGQMYSYDTIDTGFQKDFSILNTSTFTVFGGDTFISRFAFKIKLPFFFDNRVNAPDDSDVFYDEIGNVAYPKYWHSSRSVLANASASGVELTNFISIKAHNFDCPNNQALNIGGFPNPGRTYYDGKMYQFAYGIPYFYCESSINTDLRQAFNYREGDFWPHVSTNIPDDWVQESFVPIAQDNTYYYNVTYSRQNKENFFSHLPADWKAQLCYTNYPFRAIYSDTAADNADNRVNNWLTYRPIAMFDFPQNYGKLTSLDGIQNKAVLARFENKSLLYNTMLTVQTSNPQAAYLGNDTLFKAAPPIDFAETDLGYVGSQNKMLLKIPQGQVTVDAKRGQVFLVSGNQATDLSAFGSGMNRFFTDHLAFEILRYFPNVYTDNHFNGIGLHGVYDSKYDRIIISKLDYIPLNKDIKYDAETRDFYIDKKFGDLTVKTIVYVTDPENFCNKSWTLSFNVNTKSWVSFHSYIPNFYIAENNFFYSGLNGCCDDLEAIAINEVPIPPTTSTTTTASVITTTTSTTESVQCEFTGRLGRTDCDLDGGTVIILVPGTTTTTTTVCARPAGLIQSTFIAGYNIDVTYVPTLNTFAEACAGVNYFNSSIYGTPELDNIEIMLASFEVGQTVWYGYGTDCEVIGDGWYSVNPQTQGASPYNEINPLIYYIVGGVIADIVPCTCADTTTTTTTSAPIDMEICCSILFNTRDGVNYLSLNATAPYNPLLTIPGSSTANDGIGMTADKLWLIPSAFHQLDEWDITLSPFTAIFNRTVAYPGGFDTGTTGVIGLDNTTLISVNTSVSPAEVTELDITGGTASATVMFTLETDREAIGNQLYTTAGKYLVISRDSMTANVYLSQYDYATGTLEIDIDITGLIDAPSSLFECNCNIYVVSTGGVYYLLNPTYPYNLTSIDVLPYDNIYNAAQIASCVNTDMNTTTTTTTLL